METHTTIKKDDDLHHPVNSYEPPLLEVLEIAVEKGFAASAEGWNPDTW
jgi:hypothetical protein